LKPYLRSVSIATKQADKPPNVKHLQKKETKWIHKSWQQYSDKPSFLFTAQANSDEMVLYGARERRFHSISEVRRLIPAWI
jgi:hypothetical protein